MDLLQIRRRAVTVDEYIDSLKEPFKEKFLACMQTYQLQMQLIDQLKTRANDFIILVFTASWCKDCAQYVPVLDLIAGHTGLEVRVFGGLKRDPLSHTSKWRIPPSPAEVLAFGVDKIPLVIVFDLEGREIGRIVESPKRYPTLEQELWEIIKCQ